MLTRWKLMAGVLGVSIGGLAAAASQCPKFDSSKGRQPEQPTAKAEPKVAPAGAPAPKAGLPLPPAPTLEPAGTTPPAPATTPTPAAPAPGVSLDLPAPPAPGGLLPVPETTAGPAIPDVKALGATPPKPVDLTPASGSSPAVPAPSGKDEPKPTEPPAPPILSEPMKPAVAPPAPPADIIPQPPAAAGSKAMTPPAPPVPTEMKNAPKPTEPAAPLGFTLPAGNAATPPVVGAGGTKPSDPVSSPPNVGSAAFPPAGAPGSSPAMPPAHVDPPAAEIPPVKPDVAPPAAAAAEQSKFRIVLRVGEGEPTFEVKNGDNLILKVACDKVDIKSPEKGAGPSEITARGKVRFAGFGAEGTCDELKFFAGTGEVSMAGAVKVQVKDKLGRVESELTTGSMKYRLDSSAVGGQLKP